MPPDLMAKFRYVPGDRSPGIEIDVAATTVHACIDEAARRTGEPMPDELLAHPVGPRWRLADDAVVRVNGEDVRRLAGLGTLVTDDDEIEAAPHQRPRSHGIADLGP